MTPHRLALFVAALLPAAVPATSRAAEFAAKGAKATLNAEYVYESSGKKADKYDSHEWRVKRSVSMSAELVAEAAAAAPRLQPPDAQYMAKVDQQRVQAEKMGRQMAPVAAGVEALLAKCGEDEACIEREVVKMGHSMAGQKQTRDVLETGAKTTALMVQPGTLRYQAWRSAAVAGTYQIDEIAKFVSADPLCMELPGARCHRSEQRVGSGAVPATPLAAEARMAGGFAAVEIDQAKRQMFVRLPVPMNLLAVMETITTDEPRAKVPKGPQARQLDLAVMREFKPFSVALQAVGYAQSGETVLNIAGAGAQGGRLTVRWRFTVK